MQHAPIDNPARHRLEEFGVRNAAAHATSRLSINARRREEPAARS
jgi:hypothetical protein